MVTEQSTQAAAFYLSMECETCGSDMYYGLVVTTEVHNGRPVVPFDIASQTQFDCDDCDGVTYVGDLDEATEHEPGELPVDEDDEDDAEVES